MFRRRRDFARFAEKSYSWHHIERPAFDRAIPDSVYDDAATILDIGSGVARIIKYHLDRGAVPSNLTGVEPHAPYVAQSQEACPDVRFINQKIQDTTLKPSSLDLVTAQLTLRYLNNADLADTCQRVASALRPGGLFFILDVHPSNYGLKDGFRNYFKEGQRQVMTRWGEPETYYYRRLDTYANTLTGAELSLVRMDECPIAESGQGPEFQAELEHYAASPFRFALLATKPE